MRLSRRQPNMFEQPPTLPSIPSQCRQSIVEMLEALLTEALSSELSTQSREEAQDEPDRR